MRAPESIGGPRPRRLRKGAGIAVAAIAAVGGVGVTGTPARGAAGPDSRVMGKWEKQSLDGSGNNRRNPTWGQTFTIYPRVGQANYVDGLGKPVEGPNPRYLSNRVFNDTGQNLYSQRGVSQWAFGWGQFLDHTFALRLGRRQVGEPGEEAHIPHSGKDPLEAFRNDLGIIDFKRSIPQDGTGTTNPREQINQNSSYIDAFAVYGGESGRLEWMREGPADGDLGNNGARLLLPNGYLPRRDSRGDPEKAPPMVIGGQLISDPTKAAVAGDQRANENPPLLAIQTLLAREHNRIVDQLPKRMSEQEKFEIARAVVIAEQQYITYNEFLPAMGVRLPRYTGYKPSVNAALTNEFATVGYRAHSQIRGEFKVHAEKGHYSKETLDKLKRLGVTVTELDDRVELVIPLGEDAFFNPDLLTMVELGPMLQALGERRQSANDEQITNLLRSFVFLMPVEGNPNCDDDPNLPKCQQGVNDLGSVDIARGRDHGIPGYNRLRAAFGLKPKSSFRGITGERSERFPRDPQLTPGKEIDDPDSMDFVRLFDPQGKPTTPEADDATRGERRTPLAARLKAIYGDVGKVDAFIGMVSEKRLPGSELGETQHAIWSKEFAALRDGDRFHYANLPMLRIIKARYGIDYRKSLGDIISANAGIPRDAMQKKVFLVPEAQPKAAGTAANGAGGTNDGALSGKAQAMTHTVRTGVFTRGARRGPGTRA